MNPNAAKICGFCDKEYNEDKRCPRILPCFHSYCTHCINVLIKNNNKNCPACRQGFEGQNPEEFKINEHILMLLTYIKDLEIKLLSNGGRSDDSLSEEMEEMKTDTVDRINSTMRTNVHLRNNIERVTNKVQDEILVMIQEMLMTSKGSMETLEKDYEGLENQLQTLESKYEQLRTDEERSNFHKEIMSSMGLISKSKEMQQQIETAFKTKEDKFLAIEKSLNSPEKEGAEDKSHSYIGKALTLRGKAHVAKHSETSTTSSHLSLSKQYSLPVPLEGQCHPSFTRRPLSQITVESLKDLNGRVKAFIAKGKAFTSLEHSGKKRYAMLSMHENKYLCLHCLREDPQLDNACYLKHDDVMKMVDPTSKLTFLELKNISNKSLGKLIISLIPNTKKGENFFLMCSGERGCSYKGTEIMAVGGKGTDEEGVWMGDYDNKGGKALIEGAGIEKGGTLPWSAGTLGGSSDGDATAAQFGVCTRNNSEKPLSNCFGKVEDGIHILTDALQHYSHIENEVIIGDCGIVLKTF